MEIAVIGASGSIGKVLVDRLEAAGHQVIGVSRSPREGWRELGPECLAGAEAVVNLAGDRIDKRWNESNKKAFWQSRVGLAQDISRWIEAMDTPPRVWVNASAIGIYGDGGDQVLDEDSPVGEGYLAELCEAWEEAASIPASSGKNVEENTVTRIVHARIGVVLGKSTMAWQRMAKVFSLGLGGRLGSGAQWFPWVHMDDVVGGLIHALECGEIHGALNLVAPEPLRNRDFTQKVARAYAKPALFHAPAFGLKLALGGFATALLASHRVEPTRLIEADYPFAYPTLEEALEKLI